MRAPRKQCKACPWRVDVDPSTDIPNGYCELKHEALRGTISDGGFMPGPLRAMACHEFDVGEEKACVGWLANQLGPGNNIALRMRYAMGAGEPFKTVGKQHKTFEDTLPRKKR